MKNSDKKSIVIPCKTIPFLSLHYLSLTAPDKTISWRGNSGGQPKIRCYNKYSEHYIILDTIIENIYYKMIFKTK
jgi:hypothetical protein